MPDRRDPDDMRLQRLADLSIEIRMMKARVQAAIEAETRMSVAPPADPKLLPFRNSHSGAVCPHCGHTAGLALLPREYRRHSTLVRCFSCRRDAAAFDWTIAGRPAGIPENLRHSSRSRR
jgi:hypothetical protein